MEYKTARELLIKSLDVFLYLEYTGLLKEDNAYVDQYIAAVNNYLTKDERVETTESISGRHGEARQGPREDDRVDSSTT